ncbi:MAG: hypothetical protein WDN31_12495 [Hyphomicrobium sp.]
MTKMDRRAEDRQALEHLLDVYGADRTRWPARERLRFAGVISDDKAAARLLAQADALDRLLDQAPLTAGADMDALKERIMATALRSGRTRPAVVSVGGGGLGSNWAGRFHAPAFAARFTEWPAAAVLAASLMFGVVLGSAGTFDSTVRGRGLRGRLRQHGERGAAAGAWR